MQIRALEVGNCQRKWNIDTDACHAIVPDDSLHTRIGSCLRLFRLAWFAIVFTMMSLNRSLPILHGVLKYKDTKSDSHLLIVL